MLEHHGWGDLQDELNRLSKQGEWATMGELIDDEILDDLRRGGRARRPSPSALLERWGGLVDRISFYAPYETDRDTWLPVVEALKQG